MCVLASLPSSLNWHFSPPDESVVDELLPNPRCPNRVLEQAERMQALNPFRSGLLDEDEVVHGNRRTSVLALVGFFVLVRSGLMPRKPSSKFADDALLNPTIRQQIPTTCGFRVTVHTPMGILY